ncbi:hypothetical protein HAX54_051770, partial [Datura stramonium]|nr:hypothetical protein [Datura stramonium]
GYSTPHCYTQLPQTSSRLLSSGIWIATPNITVRMLHRRARRRIIGGSSSSLRNSDERSRWILPLQWEQLCTYKAKRLKDSNKGARPEKRLESEKGGSLHTCAVINQGTSYWLMRHDYSETAIANIGEITRSYHNEALVSVAGSLQR